MLFLSQSPDSRANHWLFVQFVDELDGNTFPVRFTALGQHFLYDIEPR
jgi:hypothetical protein